VSEARTEEQLIGVAHPRPWNWTWVGANASGGGHVYLTDANGRKIAAVWGKADEKQAAAELIVGCVNNAGPF
jgi:hypothetical protein